VGTELCVWQAVWAAKGDRGRSRGPLGWTATVRLGLRRREAPFSAVGIGRGLAPRRAGRAVGGGPCGRVNRGESADQPVVIGVAVQLAWDAYYQSFCCGFCCLGGLCSPQTQRKDPGGKLCSRGTGRAISVEIPRAATHTVHLHRLVP